jgi:hypothetical protein
MIQGMEWALWSLAALYFLVVLLPDFLSGGQNPTRGAAGRSFDALKLLRMKLMEEEWNKLPESKREEMGPHLAQIVNHRTGAGMLGYGKPLFGFKGPLGYDLPRGRQLVGAQGLVLLVGLVATVALPVSKFHLLWIAPLAFYVVPLTPLNPLHVRAGRALNWSRALLGQPLGQITVFTVPSALMPSSDPTTQEELNGLYCGILDKMVSGFSAARVMKDALATSGWSEEIVRWAIPNVVNARYAGRFQREVTPARQIQKRPESYGYASDRSQEANVTQT